MLTPVLEFEKEGTVERYYALKYFEPLKYNVDFSD